jgi:hypothetical protein
LPNSEQRSEIDETTPLLRCRDTTKKGVHGLVYDALDRVEVRQDERGYLLTYKGTEPKLPQVVKARIDEVLKKYANKKAWELEKNCKKETWRRYAREARRLYGMDGRGVCGGGGHRAEAKRNMWVT